MKNLVNFKIAVVFSLLFFLSQNLLAQGFIINDDNLIDKRAEDKINQIGNEVKTKLNVNVYIYTKQTLGLDEELPMKKKFLAIKNFENEILPALQKPYVLLTAFIEETHVNLIYSSEELKKTLVQWVRKEIGPIATPDHIQFAPGLPKTRSGKIMRRILRKIAEDDYSNLGDTSTLADPSVVDDLITHRMK